MKDLIFVTSNKNKLNEAEAILNRKLNCVDIDINEIQTIDPREVVVDKAEKAYAMLKKPLFVEDTALHFEGWSGFPGALIKFLLKAIGVKGIPKVLKGFDRKAEAVACICYHDDKEVHIFEGSIKGKISETPKGETTFGWDPVFIPDGHEKTFAEMTSEEKNRISHRMAAFEKFKKFLAKS